uniref:G-protein coupled receptors family 1 profile domain-containing protein n=1 Tax=Meloidogyne enterolobii TaxID=390850 RepID=A0A6V7WK06_MELEN|nr:unnamed protein product [Meloidogyne enterolobii]
MLIGEIYSTIIYCFATFGLFSNLFLIWLILRYTMKEMQVYSKILLQTCFVDIVGICMFVVSQPVYISDNGTGTAWSYGPIHFLPNPWQFVLLRINYFMARVTSMNVCTLFIYRYFTVVRDVDVKFKHQLLLIVGLIIPIFVLNVCASISNNPTPENEYLTNYEVAQTLGLDNYTIENYVVGLRSRTNDLSIFTANYASALTIINYIIIIFCGISIQIHVYRHCKGVEMTQLRNMNKQLSIVLGAQAILPLITYITTLFTNLNFLFNLPGLYSCSIAIFFTSSLGSLIAVLNPIVTILSVRNYRQIIFRCKNNSNIHQIVPMPETSMPDRTIHTL